MKLKKLLSVVAIMLVLIVTLTGCEFFEKDESESKEETKTSQSSKDYEEPIKNFFEGMEKGSAKTYLKAFPEFAKMDTVIKEETLEEMLEEFEEEYGKNIKITYEIEDKEEVEEEDLETMEKYFSKQLKADVKVTKGYKLDVEAKIKGDDDEEVDSQEMYVYEIDGEWYYIPVTIEKAESYL